MPYSEATLLGHSDLNSFLLAEIGAEQKGVPLTVASLFARCGNDPWREAGHLASLSKPAARDKLAETIAATHTRAWRITDARIIADQLLPLLPCRTASDDSHQQALVPFRPPFVGSMVLVGCAAAAAAVVARVMNWAP